MNNVEMQATMHNNFVFEVVDKNTGEVKQTAKAENLVTKLGKKNFFRSLFRSSAPDMPTAVYKIMKIGSGTGTFTDTMTAMIKEELSLATTVVNTTREITSDRLYVKKDLKAIINYNQLNGINISEVGLWSGKGSYDNETAVGLATHAFITDSQGNPITILKTETDIIYIYATVYFTVTHNAGANLSFIKDALTGQNYLTYLIDAKGYEYNTQYRQYRVQLGESNTPPAITDTNIKGRAVGAQVPTKAQYKGIPFTLDETLCTATWTYRWDNTVSGKVREAFFTGMYKSGDEYYAWTSLPFIRFVLPIGSWTEHVETDQAIATGDGTTVTFNLPPNAFPVKDGTLVVKVGGTETTEYTYNNTTGVITMNTAPGAGATITVSYKNDFIPKHQYNLLDLTIKFTFSGLAS
jgi:hypothetical protein